MNVTQGLGTQQIPTQGFGGYSTNAPPALLTQGYWSWRNWGCFRWGNGSTTNMASESEPVTTLTVESIPGRGAAADGVYTETTQQGAWTEPPVDGAYTQDSSYVKEVKPSTTGYAKESLPAAR